MTLVDKIMRIGPGLAKRVLIISTITALAAVGCDGKKAATYPEKVQESLSERYERCSLNPDDEGCDPKDFRSDLDAPNFCDPGESEDDCRKRMERIIEDIYSEEPPITGFVVKEPTKTPTPKPAPACPEVRESGGVHMEVVDTLPYFGSDDIGGNKLLLENPDARIIGYTAVPEQCVHIFSICGGKPEGLVEVGKTRSGSDCKFDITVHIKCEQNPIVPYDNYLAILAGPCDWSRPTDEGVTAHKNWGRQILRVCDPVLYSQPTRGENHGYCWLP